MKRVRLMVAVMGLVLWVVGAAGASDWEQIEKNTMFAGFIDFGTIKFLGENKDMAKFWFKSEFTKQGNKEISPKKPISHSMELFTADCGNQTLTSHEFYLYDKKKKVIQSDTSERLVTMLPDSVNENMFQYICGVMTAAKKKLQGQGGK